MPLSIVTNVNSLVAQENLRVNSDFQSRTIQRLTSGYRINSAGDDAAGLAVANKFRSDTSELMQGVRNANDGVGQLQIIDGGLNNINKILNRLKTLATQSASTTFTGNRGTLNTEYKALLSEIDRQAANVGLDSNGRFNKVIDVYTGGGGDTQGNSKVSIDLSGSANVVTATGLALSTSDIAASGTTLSKAQINLNNEAGTFTGDTTFHFRIANATGVSTHAVVYDGNGVTSGQGAIDKLNGELTGLGITASINGSGSLQFSGGTAFSVLATAEANSIVTTSAAAEVNTGLNATSATYAVTQLGAGSTEVAVVTTSQGAVTLTFSAGNTADEDAVVQYINSQLASKGVYAVTSSDGSAITLQGSSEFALSVTSEAETPGVFGAAGNKAVDAPTTSDGSAALSALKAIDSAVESLGLIQGRVGTGQNKLQYAINLAQSQISNFSAAESQIRDADVASEAANLTKAQVLQQASLAAMAQANAAPQAVLALLRG
jgi:flagellin